MLVRSNTFVDFDDVMLITIHTGGQKQASRISKLIQSCTQQIKKMLIQYQELQEENGEHPQATVIEVFDLHSNFWVSEHTYCSVDDLDRLPASSQRRLLEVCNLQERAMEEKQLVVADLIRIASFYHSQLDNRATRLFKVLNDHSEVHVPRQPYSSDLYNTIEHCVECLPHVASGAVAALLAACEVAYQRQCIYDEITEIMVKAYWDELPQDRLIIQTKTLRVSTGSLTKPQPLSFAPQLFPCLTQDETSESSEESDVDASECSSVCSSSSLSDCDVDSCFGDKSS